MSDPVSGLTNNMIQNLTSASKQQQQPQQQGGGRSFENVLQNGGGNNNEGGMALGQPTSVPPARLEQFRVDLMQRVGQLPEGSPRINALMPEFIDTKTRLGLLKEAVSGMNGTTPANKNVMGSLSNVEGEWNQLDTIMKSNKELSQGELLGVQARLYQVSQHVEVLSKVVDQMTGGIKTVLNTNV